MVPPVLDSVERKSLRTGTAFNCCIPYSCDTVLPLDFRKCRATTLDTRSRVKYTVADVWHHTLHPFPVHTTTYCPLLADLDSQVALLPAVLQSGDSVSLVDHLTSVFSENNWNSLARQVKPLAWSEV